MDLKQRRRPRQRERQKIIGFNKQNTSSARALSTLVHFTVGYAMYKQRMRLGCNRSKIDLTLHTGLRFRHRASIYRCRDYLREVFSAPLKFLAPVPKFFQDRCVYTAITGSAVPKTLGCRANFLVRVNVYCGCPSKNLGTVPGHGHYLQG